MKELLDIAFWGPNLVPAVLAAFSLFYWVMVIIGFFDFNSLDVDVDVDADVDLDVDADLDADVDADADADADADHHSGGGFKGVLTFFNIGKVPMMALLSFLSLFWWSGSILATYYLEASLALGFALLVPIFLVSLILTKFVTAPIGKLFVKMNQYARPLDAVGKICEITIGFDGDELGQARLKTVDGWANLTVKSISGNHFNRGDSAVIIEYNKTNNFFLIEPFND